MRYCTDVWYMIYRYRAGTAVAWTGGATGPHTDCTEGEHSVKPSRRNFKNCRPIKSTHRIMPYYTIRSHNGLLSPLSRDPLVTQIPQESRGSPSSICIKSGLRLCMLITPHEDTQQQYTCTAELLVVLWWTVDQTKVNKVHSSNNT